jgi:D-aminopeptidase
MSRLAKAGHGCSLSHPDWFEFASSIMAEISIGLRSKRKVETWGVSSKKWSAVVMTILFHWKAQLCLVTLVLMFGASAISKQMGNTINQTPAKQSRPRAREVGIKVGILPTGSLNAITDVSGVMVGHTTLVRGENIRTGVTAILPHGGNLFREKVPGAVFVGNGFGKLAGSTQVNELGEIETPILLTSTLSVPRVADALLDYMLSLPGNEDVQSVNPLVAETNDGYLNDIRGRNITRDDVLAAIKGAKAGIVEEGSVGAGTGTVAFGFKGGIGSSSRKLPANLGGFTVGILVQTNFGGVLTINGAPIGQELGRYYLKDQLSQAGAQTQLNKENSADGSVIIVIATDAPIDARNLRRMAARSMMGLARTGAAGNNGSGDYAIAFSTSIDVRIRQSGQNDQNTPRNIKSLSNDAMSPLLLAVIEATEEAIYNSLFRATTTTGKGHTAEALPLDRTIETLRKHGLLSPSR